jgi:ADP-ribose pyrophosphatase YjhB (NUDIX family)
MTKTCSRVLAIRPDSTILFLEQENGWYNIPGGMEEPNDKGCAIKTARRELFEETGIWINDLTRFLKVFTQLRKTSRDMMHHWYCYVLFLTEEDIIWCRPTSPEGKPVFAYAKSILPAMYDKRACPLRNVLNHYVRGQYTLPALVT